MDLSDPGIKLGSPVLPVDPLPAELCDVKLTLSNLQPIRKARRGAKYSLGCHGLSALRRHLLRCLQDSICVSVFKIYLYLDGISLDC